MSDFSSIDLNKRYLDSIIQILSENLSGREVWLYGSRANGTSYKASDVDLLFFPRGFKGPLLSINDKKDRDLYKKELNLQLQMKTLFSESNIPLFVDILSWEVIPQSFKEEILSQNHVTLSI